MFFPFSKYGSHFLLSLFFVVVFDDLIILIGDWCCCVFFGVGGTVEGCRKLGKEFFSC